MAGETSLSDLVRKDARVVCKLCNVGGTIESVKTETKILVRTDDGQPVTINADLFPKVFEVLPDETDEG